MADSGTKGRVAELDEALLGAAPCEADLGCGMAFDGDIGNPLAPGETDDGVKLGASAFSFFAAMDGIATAG